MEISIENKKGLDLVQRYNEVRSRSMELVRPLNKEDFIPQPVVFASPPKWHLAHITWFFEEFLLKRFEKGFTAYDPQFSFLFNSYYNTIGERTFRADRGSITRPDVNEVIAYRQNVDARLVALIPEMESDRDFTEILHIGLNHEEQHQELMMTDLKYVFSLNPIHPIYREDIDLIGQHNEEHGWLKVSEGVYEIGHLGDDFCFDNELGRHKVYLHDFEISRALVTNGEYLDFIADGGYERFELWLDEGWAWVQANKVGSPLYWLSKDGEWHNYTLSGLKPIDKEAILSHVSYYEAEAFARWKGMRLPTEFEWETAAPQLKWGTRWEWTNSAYLPYPGFKTAEGALGEYNGKFMVNQMVLRGASPVTAIGHSRITYRNFFHPHYQWQFSGIRLAR